MAAVVVIAGIGTYFGVGFAEKNSLVQHATSRVRGPTTCVTIPGWPQCLSNSTLPGATVQVVPAPELGPSVYRFSVNLPEGTVQSATLSFGDGKNATTSGIEVTHRYSEPGSYVVSVIAQSSQGLSFDNSQNLPMVTVGSTPCLQCYTPEVYVKALDGCGPYLHPGGSVLLEGNVTLLSGSGQVPEVTYFTTPNPNYLQVRTLSQGPWQAEANVTPRSNVTSGIYSVVYTAAVMGNAGWVYSNYTYSVAIGACPVPRPNPPPQGTFNSYEYRLGGSYSEDPAVDYETAGSEPIYNVFQTLLAYNGSLAGPDVNDFVPDLATCVPGSPYCTSLYGNTLQSGYNYTFVINSNAQFYNPTSGTHYSVWPNDVVFSFARTCLFSTFPYGNPGWIQCQALLPAGNSSWDNPYPTTLPSGLHYPYNNTPSHILSAITMNGTSCPKVGGSFVEHGCVTFDTEASGHPWPQFLEFVSEGYGSGIVSCDWATSIGAGLPGWSCGASTDPTGIANTAWDGYELGMGSSGGDYQSAFGLPPVLPGLSEMRWSMVGSGPYYLSQLTVGTGYQLKADPYWAGTGTSGHPCAWEGCLPLSFRVSTVNVVWESNATTGEKALATGLAQSAYFPSTDFATGAFPLLRQGSATMTQAPSLTESFTLFNMNFSQAGAQSNLPTGTVLNAPSNLFQDLALRQFFIHTYPYATVQSSYDSVNGTPLGLLFGGAIPGFMGDAYPMNISWSMGDPTVSSAAQWWSNVTTEPRGIAKTACSTKNPCVFPFVMPIPGPNNRAVDQLWVSNIKTYSQGAMEPVLVIENPPGLCGYLCLNGPVNWPLYDASLSPDYPDASDYVISAYLPNGALSASTALSEGLNQSLYAGPCSGVGWAWSASSVTLACQGTAYGKMVSLFETADQATNASLREFLYNEGEHIAQQLGIFVPNPGQQLENWVTAANIDPYTLSLNPMIGGEGNLLYYDLGYSPNY